MSSAFIISLLLIGCILASVSYYVARKRNLMAIVDLNWTAGLGLSTLILFLVADNTSLRTFAVLALSLCWAGRISYYLFKDRVLTGHEDSRYANLKKHWGEREGLYFYGLFLFQIPLVALFSIPLWIAYTNPSPWQFTDILGILIGITALLGEATADKQLAAFRNNPENRGKVCQTGLWRYSRHPNYFFEWLHWCAYVVFAWGAPSLGWTLLGPLLMYTFLRWITGVPHIERQSIASRGEAYKHYQQTTNTFWPWKPRKAHSK